MSLPGTKALYVGAGRIPFSPLARIFDTILYRTLHRLIGLSSVTLSGHFTFGISAIVVWFHSAGKIKRENK
jgi:hypothetical protein